MKYKLIASDFDGTLANSRDFISEENVRAAERYIAEGGIFTVSTGRMYTSILRKIQELNLGRHGIPIMSFQGALVTDSVTGEHIYKKTMDIGLLAEIAEYCEERGIYFHTYSSENIFAEKRCELNDMYCRHQHISEHMRIVGKLSEYLKNSGGEFIKGLIIDPDPVSMERVCAEVNAHFGGRVVFANSAPMLLECVDNGAGKGNTLRHVAKSLGIDMSETVAIGDSMNDLTMIQAAGIGCVVANGDARLKKYADFLAPSNDDNGVAKVIELVIEDKLRANKESK